MRAAIASLADFLPRGNLLEGAEWQRRHRFLQWVLGIHLPILFVFGVALGHTALSTAAGLVPPLLLLLAGHRVAHHRPASVLITAGLTYCSVALVVITRGSIEAHFHFFIIIGFIALYQDWIPFLWNVLFTTVSHGIGSYYRADLIFAHPAGQANPWGWSAIHGIAVLAACVGMVVFWRVSEDEQQERIGLTSQLAHSEVQQFTSELLVNLARRNQSMLYRQLDIINRLEDKEKDPDALAELFRLDHLATRVRRNAESLLVLSGEQPSRVWSAPVPLHEVVHAAIAEIEDLERVDVVVDERVAVTGHTVTDLTHLLAELVENAVRYSPPQASVTIRSRQRIGDTGSHLIVIEDWGVGMPPSAIEERNRMLADPPDVDRDAPKQLGFHVVARLAQRHHIKVSLTPTPGGGLTVAVVLPASLFIENWTPRGPAHAPHHPEPIATPTEAAAESAPPEPVNLRLVDEDPWSRRGRDSRRTAPRQFVREPDRSAEVPRQALAPAIEVTTAMSAQPSKQPRTDQHGAPRLERRVPQSHIAEELRIPESEPAPPLPAEPQWRDSGPSHALSRFQANRHAAKADAAAGHVPWASDVAQNQPEEQQA